MTTNRRLAAVAAAGLTGAVLAMPAADATTTDHGVGGAAVLKPCTFFSHGEKLRIGLGIFLGDNGRDVENVQIYATDNDGDGKYDNNDVRLKVVRLTIRDQDGKIQLNQKVAPASQGSYDIGSAGEGAGKVTVKVRWRTHHNTVNKSCSKVID